MNGKPIATDLQVLEGFAEPFIIDNIARDDRMAKQWNCSLKQVYSLWNRKRFDDLIDYGITLRSGWLTDKGREKLKYLRANTP